MAVQLRNKRRMVLVLNLPHEQACTETQCLCTRQKVGVQEHNPATGYKTVRGFNRRLAASVTLFAAGHEGATSKPLPDGVVRAPDVAGALARGDIEVVKAEEQTAAKAAEPAPPPDKPGRPPRGRGPVPDEPPAEAKPEGAQP